MPNLLTNSLGIRPAGLLFFSFDFPGPARLPSLGRGRPFWLLPLDASWSAGPFSAQPPLAPWPSAATDSVLLLLRGGGPRRGVHLQLLPPCWLKGHPLAHLTLALPAPAAPPGPDVSPSVTPVLSP